MLPVVGTIDELAAAILADAFGPCAAFDQAKVDVERRGTA